MKSKEAPEDQLENCENYTDLLRKYGPDYEVLKNKLGHIRGLFDWKNIKTEIYNSYTRSSNNINEKWNGKKTNISIMQL